MSGEHLVVKIAEGELSLLRRTGLLAVIRSKGGRELRAWTQRIRPIDGERYELVVAVLRLMTEISGILLIAAVPLASVSLGFPLRVR